MTVNLDISDIINKTNNKLIIISKVEAIVVSIFLNLLSVFSLISLFLIILIIYVNKKIKYIINVKRLFLIKSKSNNRSISLNILSINRLK